MKTAFFLLQSLRPRQWIKNVVVLAGLLFSLNAFNLELLVKSMAGVLLFCVLAGANYIFNDLFDLKQDRLHPEKSRRPLAAGALAPKTALEVGIVMAAVSILASYLLDAQFGLVASVYIVLMLLYSAALKNIVVLDVFIISLGFVLRATAGAVIVKVEISTWLVVCTFLISLLLALGKRRHERMLLNDKGVMHRKTLAEYSPQLLDQMISVVSVCTVIAYSLYTVSESTYSKFGTRNLGYTIPLVIFGVFRYLYLVYKKEGGGNPEKLLLTDLPLVLTIGIWFLVSMLLIYGKSFF